MNKYRFGDRSIKSHKHESTQIHYLGLPVAHIQNDWFVLKVKFQKIFFLFLYQICRFTYYKSLENLEAFVWNVNISANYFFWRCGRVQHILD